MFKRFFRRQLLLFPAFLLIVEALSLASLTFDSYRKHRPIEALLSQFVLTRPFTTPSRLTRVGDLTPWSSNWKDFAPADSMLGVHVARSIVATHLATYTYITNPQGFFSTGADEFSFARTKPANTFRIIVVGGSTVMGQGASPSENLPAQLKKLLPPNVEVINAGAPGYQSSQEFLYLMSELVDYHPDLVIVYDGWNDVNANNALLRRHGDDLVPLKTATHYDLERRAQESYEVIGSFRHFASALGSNALELGRNLGTVELFLRGSSRVLARLTPVRHSTDADYLPRSAALHADNWELMILLSHRYHFRIALFLQPLMGIDGKRLTAAEARVSIDELALRKAFYRDTRVLLEGLKAKYADDRAVVIDDLSQCTRDEPDTIYVDSGHLLARGNEVVARSMLAEVATLLGPDAGAQMPLGH